MESFPFGQKRFQSLPPARLHKWIALWLRKNYEDLLAKRFTDKDLDSFFSSYVKILTWLKEPMPSLEKPESYSKWLEFVSACYHRHHKKTGKGLAEANFLPRVARGDRKFQGPWSPSIPYRVAIDTMRSAFNVGSIIRVVDAVGFESVLLSSTTPGKEHGQVQKTAMTCTEWIPLEKHENLAHALIRAKEDDYLVIGIETIPTSTSYARYPWPKRGIVVVGNEEYGISEDVMKACDDFVHLPMSGRKNSINVANAFAAVAFHLYDIWNPEQR
jgi:tRNA G18 (ribose-2'-O)-methylase SpoU